MAEALTYDSLVQDVMAYCERTDGDFVQQIPRFIMLAESRIATESKHLGFVRTVTGALGSSTLAKPARWRETKSFSILVGNERKYIYGRAYEFCRSYWPNQNLTDVPCYYADYDYEHYFIAPTPNLPYQFELQFYERPEPLSATKQTNWTTQYAPSLLFYATMVEAMPFNKTPERTKEFQDLYDRALTMLAREDGLRTNDSAAVRGE